MAISPEDVVRIWFEEVWNQGAESSIDRLLTPDFVAHGLPGGPLRGAAGFKPLVQSFRGAFPDISITIERVVAQGDFVTTLCRVRGTHTGDTLGIPATGRQVDFQGMTMGRAIDGRLQEGWNVYDFLTMYQQLGVDPPPAA
jgi:steroid delta-isomerase-like uncharacterized protein